MSFVQPVALNARHARYSISMWHPLSIRNSALLVCLGSSFLMVPVSGAALRAPPSHPRII